MCYSGICRYENYMGDCERGNNKKLDFDSLCVQGDIYNDAWNYYKEHESEMDVLFEEFLESYIMMEKMKWGLMNNEINKI